MLLAPSERSFYLNVRDELPLRHFLKKYDKVPPLKVVERSHGRHDDSLCRRGAPNKVGRGASNLLIEKAKWGVGERQVRPESWIAQIEHAVDGQMEAIDRSLNRGMGQSWHAIFLVVPPPLRDGEAHVARNIERRLTGHIPAVVWSEASPAKIKHLVRADNRRQMAVTDA